MENVVGAPMSPFSAVLCGLMFGLKVIRHRQFEASFLLMSPPHPTHPKGDLTGSCKGYSTGAQGFVFVREAGAKAMGIDWMTTREELAQAIPPAYTEYVGRQMIDQIEPGAKSPRPPTALMDRRIDRRKLLTGKNFRV